MFTSLLLTLVLIRPAPAEFTINVEASRFTEWSLTFNGEVIRSGETVRTEPFVGSVTVNLTLTFVDEETTIVRTIPMTLVAGRSRTFHLVLPRVLPATRYANFETLPGGKS